MIHPGYVAGFIDADGCISINSNRNHRYFSVALIIVQKERYILDQLYKKYGGRLNYTGNEQCKYPRWYIMGEALTTLLTEVIPYIQIKKEQAKIALKAIKHQKECGRGRYRKGFVGTKPLSKHDLDLRDTMWLRCKELNTCHKRRAPAETKLNDPSNRDAIVRAY